VISSATLDLEGGAIEPPVARTRRNAPLRRMATACVRHWPALIAIAVFLTIVRAWFGPGLIAGEDFGAFGWSDIDYLRAGGPWPSAWDPTYGFGLNTQLWSTMFPVLCLAGLAARAGATWSVIERIFVLVPLAALITCVPYAFAYRVLRDRWAAAVAALLFAVNTWTIGLIERGHLPSLIAYALIPPFAYLCIRAVAAPSVRRGIALGGAGFASTLFEPRYTYMAAIAGGLLWIAGVLQRRSPLPWRAYGTFWAAFAASTLLLNLYWILPAALCPIELPRSESGFASFLGQTGMQDFVHGFAGFYPFYHHLAATDPFAPNPVEWPFLFFAALAVIGFVAGWSSRIVRSFVPLWVFGVVVAAGPHSFAGPLNVWLFEHVPGMSAFRDSTKWFALIEFAQAFGVAVFTHAAVARVRLRTGRRIPAALAFALAAVWVGAMHDAFNPLRFSNFSATVPTAGDRRYAEFLAADRVPGRVLYFPSMPSAFTPTATHPGLEAFHLAQAYAPQGLAELNPDPASILAFFHSPLIPTLLCEGGVRYVTVVPDRYSSLYTPFNRATTRGEALAFFRGAGWLDEVPVPHDPLDTSGDYYVFRVRACPPEAAAFIAPYPVAFNGNADALGALLGTPFWNDRAAVLLAEQQDPREFRRAQNVVNGVPYVSQERERDDDPVTRTLRSRLAQISAIALHQNRPFEGFVFDRRATSGSPERNLQAPSFSFARARPGVAGITLRIVPRSDEHGTLLAANFTDRAPREVRESPAAELVDPSAFAVSEPSGGQQLASLGRPAIPWMTAGNEGLTLDVINPLSVPAFVDVELPGIVSLRSEGTPLVVTLGDVRAYAWAPPRLLLDVFDYAPSVRLRHVMLPLGVSSLRVEPSAESSTQTERRFAVSTGIVLAGYVPAARFGHWTKLRVGLSTSALGTKFALSEPFPSGAPSRQRYRLLGGLNVALARRPQLRVRYVAPRSPYSLRLAFELSHDARRVEFKLTLPQSRALSETDVEAAVQRALDDRRGEERHERSLDVRALVASASTAHDDAATYVLHGVVLEIVKAGNVTSSASAAIVRSATLDVPRSTVGAPLVHDVFVSDFSQPGAFGSLIATNVRVERVDAVASRLHLNLSVEPPRQLGLPNDPRPGDHVALQLANGTSYAGTVVEATPDTLVLRQGTSDDAVASTVGIGRSSIATISQLVPDARGGVAFDVPVRAGGGRQLSFLLAVNALFQTKITLLVRDPATRRVHAVFPQDRNLLTTAEARIPPQWVSTVANLSQSAPVPLGVPWFESERAAPSQGDDLEHYALDLPSIYASELPAVREPQLVAVRFEFSLSGNAPVTNPTPADVTLSDVEVKRWTSDWSLRNAGGSLPSAQIDGRPLHYHIDFGAGPGPAAYAQARARLSAGGPHVIATANGADSAIESAFIGFGTPAGTPVAALEDAASPAASELSGRLTTAGGLLVLPRTYATGWSAALPPPGIQPSGHALEDLFRFRRYLLPAGDHVSVNDIFNGWYVPKTNGSVVFLFLPTAYGELGAALELVLVLGAVLILASRRVARR
jgi:hypothetical protein